MAKEEKKFAKIREPGNKKVHKIFEVAKKVNKIFEDTGKDQNISCKADTKKLAQSLVRLAQSLVHQHGRASRVVDGSFPYWA